METVGDILGFFASAASGGLIGGLLRLVPEAMKMTQAARDRRLELEIRKLDLQAAREGAEQKIRELEAAGAMAQFQAQFDALREAIRSQGQLTGDRRTDAYNARVRPNLTYILTGLYGLTKLVSALVALNVGAGANTALLILWTPADTQMLFGVYAFWFVGRVWEGTAARAGR